MSEAGFAIPWPDRAVRLVLGTRLVALIGAPITLLLVVTCLSPAEQGLYFVFVNVQALAQLFEVGVGSLIVQYASHEFLEVVWGPRGALVGEEKLRRAVMWLLREAGRWYLAAGSLVSVLALPLGLLLFAARQEPGMPSFAVPWIVTVVATSVYLALIPLLTTIEGGGRLINVQRMRMIQAALSVLFAWIVIPIAGGLIAVATVAVAQVAIALVWLWRYYPALLELWWRAVTTATAPPTHHVGPLRATQTRTAVGALAGHIALQALTPLVLFYQGAPAAGRMGLTLAVTIVPFTLGMAWLQGRFPEYGALVSQERRTSLVRIARQASVHATSVCLVGCSAAVVLVEALGLVSPILRARFQSTGSVAALGLAMVALVLIQAMAGFLRAFRSEPLFPNLLLGYAAMLAAAWLGAARWGPSAATAGYALTTCFVALPLVTIAFRRRIEIFASVPGVRD